jgi:hypothetical protein
MVQEATQNNLTFLGACQVNFCKPIHQHGANAVRVIQRTLDEVHVCFRLSDGGLEVFQIMLRFFQSLRDRPLHHGTLHRHLDEPLPIP